MERITEISESESGNLIFVQNPAEVQDGNYRYAIDPSNGSLLVLQTVEESNSGTGEGSSSGEVLVAVKMFESGDYILETFDPPQERIEGDEDTGHGGNDGGSVAVAQELLKKARRGRVPNKLWATRKIIDLMGCIKNHGPNFRCSTMMKVWSSISADMQDLGYSDCNKDDCSKKWSNLYRTWRKVRERPKEFRNRWKYYSRATGVVKSMANRRGRNSRSKSESIILRILEESKLHKEAVQRAEETFCSEFEKLNRERDVIIRDIKRILSKNKSTSLVQVPTTSSS